MRILSTLALAACAALGHGQTDWYVDVHATPPGTGTQSDPYTSIQYALNQPTTEDGDTIWVAPGDYVNDSVQVPNHLDIKVRCPGGPLVTRLVPPPGLFAVFTYGDLSSIRLEGLHVRTATSAAEISIGRLDRCILEHTGTYSSSSFAIRNITSVRLENCTISGFGKAIIEFGLGVSGDHYRNTLFYGNGQDMLSPNGYASTQYCSYQAGQPYQPVGNIVGQDPQIWNLAGSDFHLAPLSHCIDAGDPTTLDPDGTRADIGAIPYDATYAATPTTYCTPKVNSLGCEPLVSWSGAPSATGADDFVLIAQPVINQKPGKFIWGTAPTAGHFLGGTLCVSPPFVRGPVISSGGSASGSDCSGSYAWHFSQTYMASQGLQPGTIVYAQAWGRDPGFAEPLNSQLSDAIVFQILP
jgi:hypothetical protein